MLTSSTPLSGRSTGENTPTGRKTPVKPALKSAATTTSSDDNDSSDNDPNKDKAKKKKKKKTRTLKWDEAKIQEHDQLRGTRMRIDEPDTPFNHYDSGSETDASVNSAKGNAKSAISWDALSNKLEAHAAVATNFYPSSPSSHGGATSDAMTDEELDESQKREKQRREMKRLEFQEHRKRHYNEMEVVRRFRRECPDGIPTLNGNGHAADDDDEDNDGDDENE